MIFSRSRTILSINKGTICWTKGKVPSGKLFGEVCKKSWSEENLAMAVSDIAKRFPRRVRVVIGEDFSYATSFKKEKGDTISLEAQSRIPEDLKQGWDSMQKSGDTVQIMAVQKQLFSLIQKLTAKAGLKVEAVETESISIARLLPKEKNKAVLFARYDAVVLVGALKGGAVLTAETFDEFPLEKDIKEFTDYLTERFGTAVNQAYVQEGAQELENVFGQAGISVQQIPLDPMVGICKKRHLRGRDSEVLNISFRGQQREIAEKFEKTGLAGREKALLATFAVLLALCVLFVFSIIQSRKNVRSAVSENGQMQKK